MEVICQPVGPLQSNCYIVMENGQCLVIDPGDDANQISQMVKALGLKVDGILLTHAHFDHIGGVDTLMEEFNAPCYINPAEIEALQ
ncbi:MAG: MBL fold metallo-hydrolase, partial [Allobaculum sp.]|nr:MBL fold metallo-hydrolase [Allobaculum sp.]